jgi:hypothetical protein
MSGFFLAPQLQGQIETTVLDSVPVVKPKMRRPLYKFTNNSPKEISVLDIPVEFKKNPSTPKLNGWGSALFTSLISPIFLLTEKFLYRTDVTFSGLP